MATSTTSGPGTSLASSGGDVCVAVLRNPLCVECGVLRWCRKAPLNGCKCTLTRCHRLLMISIQDGYDFDRPQ